MNDRDTLLLEEGADTVGERDNVILNPVNGLTNPADLSKRTRSVCKGCIQASTFILQLSLPLSRYPMTEFILSPTQLYLFLGSVVVQCCHVG